ncbi:c-type cytochrome [Aquisphaera insulae]|uniref:c-type cytochrome n=1 Tax=Aquisphaera insulae TaxID=2712864 RepID=UPI0013EC6F1A|nr:c-type cytochrome [Aquisphaera insulae]
MSAASQKLKPEFQQTITKLLSERAGRPLAPKLIGTPNAAPAYLARGAEVYARYCVQCHGVNGDGNGVAATYLVPRPRNYQLGIFKFTSTTYGSKPLRDDLLRTVKRGIRGTSMPAFPLLAPRDLEAVVDYVLALTHRGELESKLAEQAEFDEQIDEAKVPEVMAEIANRWEDAKAHVVYPATPMPTFKKANVEAGKKAFESVGCSKCHGEDGRGMLASNVGTDAWGFPTKAADLTSGMLRGGTEPLDVYRHIDSGINGTPMPSFRDTLKAQPETVWNLVSYVFHVAEIRRDGAIPDSGVLEDGYLKPLPGVKAGGAPAAPAPAPAAAAASPTGPRTGDDPDVASR